MSGAGRRLEGGLARGPMAQPLSGAAQSMWLWVVPDCLRHYHIFEREHKHRARPHRQQLLQQRLS